MKTIDIKLKARRKKIIDRLNQPNYQERVHMEQLGLTWDQLREKLKIKVYK